MSDVLVTGGLGFIGSAFIRSAAHENISVANLDVETYAADKRRISGSANVDTHRIDIADGQAVAELVSRTRPKVIVHFAAETHVTRSEIDEEVFFRTNVDGTRSLLDAARAHGVGKVIHISTDEVYGPAMDHPFKETEKVVGEGLATSAYARSKALADDLALSYGTDLPVIVVRPTNCFGPWQHPEKAIARWATKALSGERLPVWGDGQQIRDWMYVDDACAAIAMMIERLDESTVVNVGPGNDAVPNLNIAQMVAGAAGLEPDAVYLTAYDRPQHDRRYSVDASRIRDLGWAPSVGVAEGVARTVVWFSANRAWWEPLVAPAEALYADDAER